MGCFGSSWVEASGASGRSYLHACWDWLGGVHNVVNGIVRDRAVEVLVCEHPSLGGGQLHAVDERLVNRGDVLVAALTRHEDISHCGNIVSDIVSGIEVVMGEQTHSVPSLLRLGVLGVRNVQVIVNLAKSGVGDKTEVGVRSKLRVERVQEDDLDVATPGEILLVV